MDAKTDRPVAYEDLTEYIPHNGTMEFYKRRPDGRMEFTFKTESNGVEANFTVAVEFNGLTLSEAEKPRILHMMQCAHDWKTVLAKPAGLPA